MDVNEKLKFCENSKKKKFFLEGWRVGLGVGGHGGCERRIEVFVKIQKKKWERGVGGRGKEGRGRGRLGGQGGCDRRIESFLENSQKKNWGGGRGVGSGWWGVRVDVNEELKFL